MNDAEFDDLLQKSLPGPPPDDVARETTPWGSAMSCVLVGLALSALTLNFWNLNYILPAVGLVLMLLGFRSLRRENGWFSACLILSVLRLACLLPLLVLNAAACWRIALGALSTVLSVVSTVALFALLFCLWNGLKAVKRSVGLPATAGAAAALMVWFLLIFVLVYLGFNGTVAAIAMLVAYVLILRALFKLSGALDEAGYAIHPAPVRVSDRAVVLILLALLVAGTVCGCLFGASFPMEWTARQTAETAEVTEIKAQLLDLGFPEDVLGDLTEEDILGCKGALQVVTVTRDHPVNDGREVTTHNANITSTRTVFDVEELRVTSVGVQLPGEREEWKLFHHFRFVADPGFYGTESIQLWPADRMNEGWIGMGGFTGQLLYDRDGQTYTAPYYSLGKEVYPSNSPLWGSQTSTDVFADFSLPNDGAEKRGYVSYSIKVLQSGYIVDSWINYTHQTSWLQYPAKTAKEARMAGVWNGGGVFRTAQDALQFYPSEEGAEVIGAGG